MKRSRLPWVALVVATPLLASVLPAAAAHAALPGKATVPHASVATHPAASHKAGGVQPSAISGYQIITSSSLADPAGTQTSGDAVCPRRTKVVGGGAVISSTSLAENMNGSVPLGKRTWRVYINNSGGSAGTFTVYAVCVSQVPGYVQVTSAAGVDNPSGSQNTATATCPTGKVPLGGGGLGSSFDPQVNLNTSVPLSNGWRVDVNNNSAGGDTAFAWAVCAAAPPKYAQKTARTATTVDPSTQTSSQARCPAGTVTFGGGSFSSSGSVLVNLNSSFPLSATTWKAYQNNSSTGSNSLTAYAVCGKAASAA